LPESSPQQSADESSDTLLESSPQQSADESSDSLLESSPQAVQQSVRGRNRGRRGTRGRGRGQVSGRRSRSFYFVAMATPDDIITTSIG